MSFSSFHLPSFFIVHSEIPEPIFTWIGRQYNLDWKTTQFGLENNTIWIGGQQNFRAGSDVVIVVI
jgi:hypothetical protein